MDFLAQPALGPDAEAVTHDQHPHHQLRINRGPPGVAVERCEVLAQLTQVEKRSIAAQQVIGGNVIVEIE